MIRAIWCANCSKARSICRPGLALLEDENVVVRAGLPAPEHRKVAVISGGGSGHEPAHAGYVGRGIWPVSDWRQQLRELCLYVAITGQAVVRQSTMIAAGNLTHDSAWVAIIIGD